MKAKQIVFAWMSLACVAGVRAEAPETLGFWTFEGENGAAISETREVVTFPNRIAGSDATLQVTYPNNGTSTLGANAPIPRYTNEVQYAYLFSDNACTGAYVTCTSSLFSKCQSGGANTYGKARSTLCVTNIGTALGTHSFTLEFIYKTKAMTGWMRFLQMRDPGRANAPFTLFSNGVTGGIGYFSLTESSGGSQSYPSMQSGETTAFGALDGGWHHFAMKWSATDRKWYFYVDYYNSQIYSVTDETLNLTEAAFFEIFAINDSFNADNTLIQAVRLTRGDLPVGRMLQVSKYTTPPETIARYRFNGEIGTNAAYCANEVLDRADLRIYRCTAKSAATYAEAPKKCVRENGDIVKNPSSLTSGATARMEFRGDVRCTVASLTPSFTHEFFFKTYSTSCSGGHVYFFGEASGPYALASGGAVWYVGLTNSSDGKGHAQLRLFYRTVSGGTVSDGYPEVILIDPDVWYHLALTYDETARKLVLYLNGQPKITRTFADGVEFCRGTTFCAPIGYTWCNWNGSFNGAWDEYRVTRRALEPSEFLKATNGDGLSLLVR